MSKATVVARRASYKDLQAVPDHLIAEILDGDLWVSPRPVPRHSHVVATLLVAMVPPFQDGNGGPGGWHFLPDIELHLGGDVLVPDLAGWRCDRHLNLMELPHIRHSPDWVGEILSPSTEKIDRGLKMQLYAREKVRHLWLVDPRTRTLEIFTLAAAVWVPIQVLKNDATVSAAPFDAAPFKLSRLWPGA
jgi:hypothetical protein